MSITQIRCRRLDLGIGQSELARRIGTSRQHLIRLENGENRPGVDLAIRIADELRTTVKDLFESDSLEPTGTEV